MNMHPNSIEPTDVGAADERLPYDPPQLLDRGLVSELTQSNGSSMGSDGFYS